MEWILECALIGLLAATLFHALRLERALGVLKRDRAALEELVLGFNASTLQAEAGVERLRAAAEGVGRDLARQIEAATGLKDDLVFLSERAERAADRLDAALRAGRAPAGAGGGSSARPAGNEPPPRAGGAELTRAEMGADAAAPRVRSQAERDLIKALRLHR